jgi:hypothetical protein
MSADLDELFTALGRQADSLPIGTAEQARDRGRRRTRQFAAVSVAVAILLAVVGVGIALRPPDHRAVPSVTHPFDPHTIPQVGSAIGLGEVAGAKLTTGDGRAYAAWIKAADNSLWLTAADLLTGTRSWSPRQIIDPHRALDRVVVTPSAVLVVTRSGDGSEPEVGLFAFDPKTGAPLWQSEAAASELVFAEGMLIRLDSTTGLTEGLDWATGERRWSLPSTGDRPVTVTGMATPADEARMTGQEPPQVFGDGRFVLVTKGGAVQVRDVASGSLRRTVPHVPDAGDAVVAYAGWLYSHDVAGRTEGPQRVRLTDLTGDAGSRAVSVPAGSFVALGACGADRACVITQAGTVSKVTAVDVRAHRVAWTTVDKWGGEGLSSANGWILVNGASLVLDRAGRTVYSSDLNTIWLDGKTLLVIAPDGSGRPAKLSTTNGKLTPIGASVAELNGNCTSTTDRLVCVATDDLRVLRVG